MGNLPALIDAMETDASDGLATLQVELRQLAGAIHGMFELATAAVRQPAPSHHQQLTQAHRRIVRKRAEIEVASLALLKLPGLPAGTMLQAACAIEIAAELERIAYLLRHMVRSPLLTHRSTSQEAGAVIEAALSVSQESVDSVLAGLSTAVGTQPALLLTARGRVEAQFALVYDWIADSGAGVVARPYLRRQLMQLAQHHRELSNRILNLNEWIIYSSSHDVFKSAEDVWQADLTYQSDKETVQ